MASLLWFRWSSLPLPPTHWMTLWHNVSLAGEGGRNGAKFVLHMPAMAPAAHWCNGCCEWSVLWNLWQALPDQERMLLLSLVCSASALPSGITRPPLLLVFIFTCLFAPCVDFITSFQQEWGKCSDRTEPPCGEHR